MKDTNEFNQLLNFLVPDWKPITQSPIEMMKGNYCILEAIDADKHAKELFQSLQIDNQGESWTYLPYGPFNNLSEFRHWLITTNNEMDTQLYAILDSKNHHPIGISGYLRVNPQHGSIEVGHLHFSKLLQRTPMATEAMYLMMKHAFEDLKYRRYEWKCNSLNEASRNAAIRLGFTFEGIFRQSHVLKNRNRDTAWFSIIDSEWSLLKSRFEKWLSPENFDSNGKQFKSLIMCS